MGEYGQCHHDTVFINDQAEEESDHQKIHEEQQIELSFLLIGKRYIRVIIIQQGKALIKENEHQGISNDLDAMKNKALAGKKPADSNHHFCCYHQ